jgi:hypothetical protein
MPLDGLHDDTAAHVFTPHRLRHMTSQTPSSQAASPRAQAMPFTPAQKRMHVWAYGLLTCWLLAVVVGPQALAVVGIALDSIGHSHLDAHGQPFVDVRGWWQIPHAANVLSNLPLAAAGLMGLCTLRGREMGTATRLALLVFFTGLLLTSVGSASYHWAPDAQGLVWDRVGMAVSFAGVLSLGVAVRVGASCARLTLSMVLVLGVLSACMPLTHGNVLPWAVVQFGSMALMVWLAMQKRLPDALSVSLCCLITLYALAKLLEVGDAAVYSATGEWVSGHSLKHVVAALAAWPVIRAVRQNAPRTAPTKTPGRALTPSPAAER